MLVTVSDDPKKRISAAEAIEHNFFSDYKKEKIENIPPKSYRMEKLNKGIYGIFVEHNTFNKLFSADENYSQAKAAIIKNDNAVSFILIKDYGDAYQGNEKHLAENIPHEINHLVAFFTENKGYTFTDESNPNIRKGFLLYREELLCKLCSNGAIMGYDHIRLNKSLRDKLRKEEPDTLEKIDDYSNKLYKSLMCRLYYE